MTRRPVHATGVKAEIREAAAWYAERDRSVGARFVAAVDEAIRATMRWPDAGTPVEDVRADLVVRRVPVGRFPYQLVYAADSDVLYVLAVAHHHRRPGYWAERLPG